MTEAISPSERPAGTVSASSKALVVSSGPTVLCNSLRYTAPMPSGTRTRMKPSSGTTMVWGEAVRISPCSLSLGALLPASFSQCTLTEPVSISPSQRAYVRGHVLLHLACPLRRRWLRRLHGSGARGPLRSPARGYERVDEQRDVALRRLPPVRR